MHYDFSVIICTYTENRWHEVMAALDSVRHQSLPAREIILVVDHNEQLLRRIQAQVDDVLVTENVGAQGLSGSRNSGLALATSPLVAFLDDDALASVDWLQHMGESFAREDVIGTGGPVLPNWQLRRVSWMPEEFLWVVGCTYRGMPDTACIIRNPIGANMAFRREVFEAVGGFQEHIGRIGTRPLGCEETELCIRARQHWPAQGFLYQPLAPVFHFVPESRMHWHYFFSRCYSEGLSKAFISRYVGAQDSLSSERSYTMRVLPLGVLGGLADALLRRDASGLLRAWAICSGLITTALGYVAGRIRMLRMKPQQQRAPEIVALKEKVSNVHTHDGTKSEQVSRIQSSEQFVSMG